MLPFGSCARPELPPRISNPPSPPPASPADRGVPRAPSRGCRTRRWQGDLRSALGEGFAQYGARTLHASPVERRAQPGAAGRVGYGAFRDPCAWTRSVSAMRRPKLLELVASRERRTPTTRETTRQRYVQTLERALAREFADWRCESFRTAMDLERSFRSRLRAWFSRPRHRRLGRHRRQRAGERYHHRRHPHTGHPLVASLPRTSGRPAPLPGPKGHRAARHRHAHPLTHGMAERRGSKVGALGVRAEQRGTG